MTARGVKHSEKFFKTLFYRLKNKLAVLIYNEF